MHLVAGGHPHISRSGQIRPAPTGPGREMRHPLVRILRPGQVGTRRTGLFTRLAPATRAAPTSRLALRRHPARQHIIRRRRHRRVPTVTRQPPLQLRDPLRRRRHLRLKLLDQPGLRDHQREQLLTRRLLEPEHPTIIHTRRPMSRTNTPTGGPRT